MRIVVDVMPNVCHKCLFLESLDDITICKCILIGINIPLEIAVSTRLGNCKLVKFNDLLPKVINPLNNIKGRDIPRLSTIKGL